MSRTLPTSLGLFMFQAALRPRICKAVRSCSKACKGAVGVVENLLQQECSSRPQSAVGLASSLTSELASSAGISLSGSIC